MPGPLLRCTLMALAVAAAGVSGYLAVETTSSDGRPAGCGAVGSLDCDDVLTSHWAKVAGVSVALPAVGLYATLLLAVTLTWGLFPVWLRAAGWMTTLLLAATAASAALWFLGLQWIDLGRFCPYCLTVHLCGLLIAGLSFARALWPGDQSRSEERAAPLAGVAIGLAPLARRDERPEVPGKMVALALSSGVAIVAVLALVQLMTPPESRLVVRQLDPPPEPAAPQRPQRAGSSTGTGGPTQAKTSAAPASPQSSVPADVRPTPPSPRTIGVLGGTLYSRDLNVEEHPRLGRADAPYVAVELFDYTCSHCRHTYEQMETVRGRYGDELALLLIPVPLNSNCNRLFTQGQTPPDSKHACLYAALARAVWRHQPEAFERFHHYMMQGQKPPSPPDARDFASKLIGPEIVDTAIVDPEIRRELSQGVDLWDASQEQHRTLPVVLLPRAVISGEAKDADELFEKIQAGFGPRPEQR